MSEERAATKLGNSNVAFQRPPSEEREIMQAADFIRARRWSSNERLQSGSLIREIVNLIEEGSGI